MRRVERWITAAVVALIALAAVLAQVGILDPVAAGGRLVGSVVGVAAPDLDDPAMIRRGAGHYEQFCANCHASPDRPERAAALELTPPPPALHARDDEWPPELLFARVLHGVPNTAMPAWPAREREDEVWAMVAFLRVLPELDAADYTALAGVDAVPEGTDAVVARCANCHGVDGRGVGDGAFPRLDILSEAYIRNTLEAFRSGARQSGFMQAATAGLKDEELAALAAHFAGAPVDGTAPPPALIAHGIPERRIPACGACHGPPEPARPAFPNLAGQDEPYLLNQLRLFAEGKRGGGPYVTLMQEAVRQLKPEHMAEAAAWYAAAGGE